MWEVRTPLVVGGWPVKLKSWRYKAGKPRINRVTVREQWGAPGGRSGGTIRMEYWLDGKKRFEATGTHDHFKAVILCERKADELLAIYQGRLHELRRRRGHQMRQDLLRVARRVEMPEDYAPPLLVYQKHGRFTVCEIRTHTAGTIIKGKSRNPVAHWCESVRALGLKPAKGHRFPKTSQVIADIRRVALKVGRPSRMPTLREYARHGKYSDTTIRNKLGKRWGEVARAVCLDMSPAWRALHSVPKPRVPLETAA